MKRTLTTSLLLILVFCGMSGVDAVVPSLTAWDGALQVYGSLRAMYHEGQIGTMISVGELLPDPDLYAVGALTGLAGEITVIGGDVHLAFPDDPEGSGTIRPDSHDTEATLLVAARVPAWISVTTKNRILFEDLDEAIGMLAASVGLDTTRRFPFLLEGSFEGLQLHVIDGSRLSGGGSSHRDHLEASTQKSFDEVSATLIGFFSNVDQGVFTHKDSTTHIHCVLDESMASGHLDHVVIPAGTTVRFPKTADP